METAMLTRPSRETASADPRDDLASEDLEHLGVLVEEMLEHDALHAGFGEGGEALRRPLRRPEDRARLVKLLDVGVEVAIEVVVAVRHPPRPLSEVVVVGA